MNINRNEYNYFLKNILDAIEQSTGIYGNDAFKVVAMSSLELMWDRLYVDDYYYNHDITEEEFVEFFEQRTKENNIDKYIHGVLFSKDIKNEEASPISKEV